MPNPPAFWQVVWYSAENPPEGQNRKETPPTRNTALLLTPGAALLLNASAEDRSAQKTRSCRRRRSEEGGFVCSEQMNSGKRRTNTFLPVCFIFMKLDGLLWRASLAVQNEETLFYDARNYAFISLELLLSPISN